MLIAKQEVEWESVVEEAWRVAGGWVYLDGPLALAVETERQQLLAIVDAVLVLDSDRLSAAVKAWQGEGGQHG